MVNPDRKWALIIGGSQGLGLASAKELASDGFSLVIIHRDSRVQMEKIDKDFESLKKSKQEVLTFNKDALKTETIDIIKEVCLKKNIKFKVLLHSLAKGNLKPLFGENSLSTDDYQQTINAMAVNFYTWAKAVVDTKVYSTDAKFIAFTSEGNSRVLKNYGAVSAAKSTLEAITRQMAVEFAPFKITSNCIQAGVTATDSLMRIPNAENIIEFNQRRNPFKRLTQPGDVGKVVSLLASDKANWINGCVIPVDGGERLI